MTTTWLDAAQKRDLTNGYGNGPFAAFLGVVLHVNVDESGTPITFWGPGNSGSVVPNFQVMKDGTIDQMLPFDWQPWCQVDGNFNYAAIETAGLPTEPLTDAQCESIARILRIYHDEMGMSLVVTDTPGRPGFGVHSMGGISWGGHACPGDVRAAQRQHILDLASGIPPVPTPPPGPSSKEIEMFMIQNDKSRGGNGGIALVMANGAKVIHDVADVANYKKAGVPGPVPLAPAEFNSYPKVGT